MRADLQRLKRDTESGRSAARTIPAVLVEESQVSPSRIDLWVSENTCGRAQTPQKSGGFELFLRLSPWLPLHSGSPVRLSLAAPQSLGDRPTHERWEGQIFSGIFGSLATDGSRLYYVESPFVSPVLKQVSTVGGETAAIATPFLVNQIGDISPDRSSF